jgi:tRNA(Ile)-lysidine synthase
MSQKKNYSLLRPLLGFSKEELLHYLQKHDYPYFIDESNSNEKYERNRFRKQFSDAFILEYKEGVSRSFAYLLQDKEIFENNFETIYTYKQLHIIKLHNLATKVKASDLTLKKLGYLLSASQRTEIEKENSLVIGGKWAIELQDDLLYIAPYINSTIPKRFKEKYRTQKIPNKIRPYCYTINISTNPIGNT